MTSATATALFTHRAPPTSWALSREKQNVSIRIGMIMIRKIFTWNIKLHLQILLGRWLSPTSAKVSCKATGGCGCPCRARHPRTDICSCFFTPWSEKLVLWWLAGFCEQGEPRITQAYPQEPASSLAQSIAKAISPSLSKLQSFLEMTGSFT